MKTLKVHQGVLGPCLQHCWFSVHMEPHPLTLTSTGKVQPREPYLLTPS